MSSNSDNVTSLARLINKITSKLKADSYDTSIDSIRTLTKAGTPSSPNLMTQPVDPSERIFAHPDWTTLCQEGGNTYAYEVRSFHVFGSLPTCQSLSTSLASQLRTSSRIRHRAVHKKTSSCYSIYRDRQGFFVKIRAPRYKGHIRYTLS